MLFLWSDRCKTNDIPNSLSCPFCRCRLANIGMLTCLTTMLHIQDKITPAKHQHVSIAFSYAMAYCRLVWGQTQKPHIFTYCNICYIHSDNIYNRNQSSHSSASKLRHLLFVHTFHYKFLTVKICSLQEAMRDTVSVRLRNIWASLALYCQ